jgi:hypothetical protein
MASPRRIDHWGNRRPRTRFCWDRTAGFAVAAAFLRPEDAMIRRVLSCVFVTRDLARELQPFCWSLVT